MHYILAGRVSGQHQTNSRWAWIRKGATPNHLVKEKEVMYSY